MARHLGPRVGSAPYKIICRVVDLGGTANKSALMPLLTSEFQSRTAFKTKVTDVLERYAFVTVADDVFKATPAGKDYVAQFAVADLPVEPRYVGQIVPARTAPPIRPLDLRKHFAAMPSREGAFAHRDIPSLMGGKRILPNRGIGE